MNRRNVLALIESLLSELRFHPALCAELADIIAKSGYESNFFNLLLIRLKYLGQHKRQAVNYPEGFEELRHTHNLYSMRLVGKGFNVRILYSFDLCGNPLLLLGFAEKSGKRNTSYTNYIPAAEKRLLEETGGSQ